ncbi:uncharacterized protein V1510DRAFT_418125 [Dipodascopsis tothii]|uniref:uncharacterized protein n=1 Tax=Dipodascopsis tothii TaxID=44089 RepID=UPI0034CD5D9C
MIAEENHTNVNDLRNNLQNVDDQPEALNQPSSDAPHLDQIMTDTMSSESGFNEADADRVGALLESLDSQPYSYVNHQELISLLKKAGESMEDELDAARQNFCSLFMVGEVFYLEWINEIKLRGTDIDTKVKVLELYAAAVQDLLSVPLWQSYLNYILSEHEAEVSAGRTEEEIFFSKELVEQAMLDAVSSTNHSIPNSNIVWDIYRDYKLQEAQKSQRPEDLQIVKKLYLSRLRTIHQTVDETFSAYSNFITMYENHKYEQEMVSANKIYSETKRRLSDRAHWETAVSTGDLGQWMEYINWELSRPKKYFEQELVRAHFERALQTNSLVPSLWRSYALFLLENVFPFSTVEQILKRSCKACPWSGELWGIYIRTLERFDSSASSILEVKDRALDTKLLSLNATEFGYLAVSWLAYVRRSVSDWDSPDESFLVDNEIHKLQELAVHETPDPHFRLQQMILFLRGMQGKLDLARREWERLSKKHVRESRFWLKWFEWELRFSTNKEITASGILTSAVNIKSMDHPEQIFDRLLLFEDQYGTAFSTEIADIKVKKAQKHLEKRRWEEAQQNATIQAHQQELKASFQHGNETAQTTEKSATLSIEKRKLEESHSDEKSTKRTKQAAISESTTTKDRENNTVIVDGLPTDCTDAQLRSFFEGCGEITSLHISLNSEESHATTATVSFLTHQDVLSALTRDQKKVGEKIVSVSQGAKTTLWITNFPASADRAYIEKLFSPYGEIVDVRFPSLTVNNKRRFCYLQFKHSEQAQLAVNALHDHELPDIEDREGRKKKLVVKISDPSQRQGRQGALYEGRELYVRNIAVNIKETDLRKLFEKFGTVEKIRMPTKDKLFGLHQGFGFITFSTPEEAKRALELDFTKVGSKAINVSIANPKGGPKPFKTRQKD